MHDVDRSEARVTAQQGNDGAAGDVRGVPSTPPDYEGYRPLTLQSVADRLASYEGMPERLGGAPSDWSVREVGDGNLNYVYIVKGPDGSVCVKQALPYVRLVGESWPLPLSRSYYEHAALIRQHQDAVSVPQVLRFDGGQALIVMENLARHRVLRYALIDRERHESVAPTLGRFMAETLFRSSDFALPAAVKKAEMALFAGNTALQKITEDLVFTDPYTDHPLNDFTPELADDVARIHADTEWKVAVQELKWAFLTRAEALVHGDLHTGSVMVAAAPDEDVRVIDPEFAFYGPIGFDVGALIANLWLNAAAQEGHGEGFKDARDWVLEQVSRVWDAFAARFGELWRTEHTGDAWPPKMFGEDDAGLALVLARIEEDALGFAGAKMARRILGLAGVADLQRIEPTALRAQCERRALNLARQLVVERRGIGTISNANALAARIFGERP